MSTCPYQNVKNNFSFFGGSEKKVQYSTAKCPYSENKPKIEEKNEKKEEKPEKKDEVSSDEEEKQTGGCPVMNKSMKNFFKSKLKRIHQINTTNLIMK
jgi:hypothetical protein